MGQALE